MDDMANAHPVGISNSTEELDVKIRIKGYTGLNPENIESALYFYFGSEVSFSVEPIRRDKTCPECGKVFSHYTG